MDDAMYYVMSIERTPEQHPDGVTQKTLTKRRYSEFDALNKQLSCHCDRVQLLTFPTKQALAARITRRGSFRDAGSPDVLARSGQLDGWLNEVLEICRTGCPPGLGRAMLSMIEHWFLTASSAEERALRYTPQFVQYRRQSNDYKSRQLKQQQLDSYFLDFSVWADRLRIDHGIDLLQDPTAEECAKLKDLQATRGGDGGSRPSGLATVQLKELKELIDIKMRIQRFLALPTKFPHPQSNFHTAMFFCVTKRARVTKSQDVGSQTVEWLTVGHVVECLSTENDAEHAGVLLVCVPTAYTSVGTGWVRVPLDGSREPLVRIKSGAQRHGAEHVNCRCQARRQPVSSIVAVSAQVEQAEEDRGDGVGREEGGPEARPALLAQPELSSRPRVRIRSV
jgi:hypothetical protein